MPQLTVQIAAGADDAHVERLNAVYDGAATGQSATNNGIAIQKAFGTGTYTTRVGIYRFDTSAIPDTATITSATFRLYVSAKANADTRSFSGEWYTWTPPVSSSHFTTTDSATAFTAVSITSSITTSAYNTFTLLNPDTNISKTGYTGIRCHITGTAPAGNNYVIANTYETAANLPELVVTYTLPSETLIPVAGGSTTNLATYDHTVIDDDPDASGTDFLTGSDPVNSGQTNGPEYVDGPASSTAWSGGTAATWGTYANVIDTSESTNSTVTMASTNTDYQNWFTFAAGDWSDLPSDATITGFSVTIRHSVGTANRVQTHLAIGSTNGTLLGNELNAATNAVDATTQAAITNTEQTVSAWSVLPTRAQLVTGTFGVRLRMRRSNTSTYTVYSIEATATYSTPTTVNTAVTAPMSNPSAGKVLMTGTDTGEVRIQVRKLGSGSNPQARAEIWQTGGGSALATPIADTTVSTTATAGTVLSGTFNQNVITSANDVEVRIAGTGASGGLVEVGAIEWIAAVEDAPPSGATWLVGSIKIA